LFDVVVDELHAGRSASRMVRELTSRHWSQQAAREFVQHAQSAIGEWLKTPDGVAEQHRRAKRLISSGLTWAGVGLFAALASRMGLLTQVSGLEVIGLLLVVWGGFDVYSGTMKLVSVHPTVQAS
jgi:hypothetical protein